MNISPNQPIRQRCRPDLKVERGRYEGHTSILIKDPISLKYVRFREEEFAILELLDGDRSLSDIQAEFEERFRPRTISYGEILQFISRLQNAGLLLSDAPGVGDRLLGMADQRRRHRLRTALGSIMYVKLPGVDPERFLNWLYPKCRWMYSPIGIVAALVLMLSAVTLVVVNFDEFQSKPELTHFQAFFNVYNIVWLWLALGIAKIIHEIGHGLTCIHFGGECHEMGVLFLVFSPCLYCNVSDAWMLQNKWHRIAISAAGIYIEVLLAAIATFVWWYSEPGLIHNLAFGMLIVCSVSTIVFNANPLMRFDGYYVFSDWVEIPNLRQKSSQLVRRFCSRICLGIDSPESTDMPRSRKRLFVSYAVAAVVYRWVISAAILIFLYTFLEPYKLSIISHILTGLVLFTLIGLPAMQFARFVFSKQRTVPMKKLRVALTLTVLAALVGAALLVPIPHRVDAVLTIEPADAEPIFVDVAGTLNRIKIEPGQQVAAGTILAELANDTSLLELEELQRTIGKHAAAVETYHALNRPGAERRSQNALMEARTELASRQEQLKQLTIRAPRAGSIIPPPQLFAQQDSQSADLPNWSGRPLDAENLLGFLQYGTLLCYVGDSNAMQAIVVIDQSQIEFVERGDIVRLKFDAYPRSTLSGRIEEISYHEAESTPHQLSTRTGGELATRPDASGREQTFQASYQARVSLDGAQNTLQPGLRGRAKIECGSRTCAQWLSRSLANLFRFSF